MVAEQHIVSHTFFEFQWIYHWDGRTCCSNLRGFTSVKKIVIAYARMTFVGDADVLLEGIQRQHFGAEVLLH